MTLFGIPSQPSQGDEEYYAVPNVPYEDVPQHNNNGFCGNMGHECHEKNSLSTS